MLCINFFVYFFSYSSSLHDPWSYMPNIYISHLYNFIINLPLFFKPSLYLSISSCTCLLNRSKVKQRLLLCYVAANQKPFLCNPWLRRILYKKERKMIDWLFFGKETKPSRLYLCKQVERFCEIYLDFIYKLLRIYSAGACYARNRQGTSQEKKLLYVSIHFILRRA